MRVHVGGHWVEGTAEEVTHLLSIINAKPAPCKSHTSAPSADRSIKSPFVSEELALSVLTRRELGDSHLNVLKFLYAESDNWTAAPDLQRGLGLSTREFAGVLGSFGKRLANTEGAGSSHFFDQYWNGDDGYNLYRLPPSVRAAMRKAGLAE